MNKTELIDKISAGAGITKAQAKAAHLRRWYCNAMRESR